MNTTETFWDVDGVSLQTFAYNITTLGGSRESARSLRGDDYTIPFQVGSTWVPKTVDSHIISLGMWVVGANSDGTVPREADARRLYDKNWRMLRKLLFREGKQFTLTKRFWVPSEELIQAGIDISTLPSQYDMSLMTASAQASFQGGLDPSHTGEARAVFTVDLKIHKSYFKSAPVTKTNLLRGDVPNNIFVVGDAATTNVAISIAGPYTNPWIKNVTNGAWIKKNTATPDGTTTYIDVANFRASNLSGAVITKITGEMSAADGKTKFWLPLEAGMNDIRVYGAGPINANTRIDLAYEPVWM